MSGHPTSCDEFHLLIQADLDGELDAAATAALSGHVRDCPGCSEMQAELTALSQRMRQTLAPYKAPEALRLAMQEKLLPPAAFVPDGASPPAPSGFRRRLSPLLAFGGGAAIAASLMLLVPASRPDADAELLAGHIRALQPGHLTDVASTDQHTVKPWFDGRIDYAPPVNDFAAEGFPLIGGRLDYIGGRAVAALVYRHDKHPIDLFVWPASGSAPVTTEIRNGFTIVRWTRDGMAFRAVSDLNARELDGFAALWQTASQNR